MNELRIGVWVKREGAFRRHIDEEGNERWTGPRWHRCESVVDRAAVTRCGKTMQWRDSRGRELEVRDTQPLTRAIGQPHLCRAGCDDQVGDGMPEDDGSTAPTDDTP